MNEFLYDFDDILIEPVVLSEINSRSEINIYDSLGNLPLMTAPMDTVIDEKNTEIFVNKKITAIVPRKSTFESVLYSSDVFLSYSLEQFEDIFLKSEVQTDKATQIKALIDVANGHMKKLYEISKMAKEKYGDSLCLMVGNVANPKTFKEYSEIGIDMIRIGIGNGNGCLTTVQTGVGYPMASLISECHDIKYLYGHETKIVADGGFKKYADIIKGLALGADYVMIGSIFNKALDSAGETTKENGDVIDQYSPNAMRAFQLDIPLFKTFRGMSTKEVQKKWGKEQLTTSEGVVRRYKVEYTLDGWVKNFEDYLRSAMSYTGKKELSDFIGRVNYNFITNNSFRRFDK